MKIYFGKELRGQDALYLFGAEALGLGEPETLLSLAVRNSRQSWAWRLYGVTIGGWFFGLVTRKRRTRQEGEDRGDDAI
jgi:hypothetical protein